MKKNNLKLYLIAELIKEAGHDIGHLPLSHALEIQLLHKKGFHEDIGKRILIENQEIEDCLINIDPNLPKVLKECLENDILNSKTHDESNYDVDRLDYLNRDNLYLGRKINFPNEQYKILFAHNGADGNIKKKENGSILINDSGSQKRIDVYKFESLKPIEKFLVERVNSYKNIYCSPELQIRDYILGNFINLLFQNKISGFNNLTKYLKDLKNASIDEIDLDEYLSWNDLKFFNEFIEGAQNIQNKKYLDYICLIIPPLENLMTFTHQALNLKEHHSYSDEECKFIQKIKELIYNNNELSNNLRNKNFLYSNIILFNSNTKSSELLKEYSDLIHSSSVKINGYKTCDPIYVQDSDGEIYDLHNHPKNQLIGKNIVKK